ncbi:MAG: HAMP domain-containing histidine kinase, partial [Bacteroidia bacterium]|nr:HAMP domain-containing histidine kinase [Bacteroidia bacterium]
ELLARVRTHIALKKSTDLIREINLKLKIQAKELQKLNEEKQALLQVVSHNLRNPLQNQQFLLEEINSLLNQNPDKEIKGLLIDAMRLNERMQIMVNNYLSLNKIESGEQLLHTEPFSLTSVWKIVNQEFEQKLLQKKQTVISHFTAQQDMICMDKQSCIEVLENLLSNAIKFSPIGSTIETEIAEENEAVIFRISDQGPGVKPNEIPLLFGKFKKLSARPTAGESSIGLGLSICKQLLERQGGKLWYEEITGKGATFAVEFPSCKSNETS